MKNLLFAVCLSGMGSAFALEPEIREIRIKAVGEKIGTLTTVDGRTYQGVTLVSVDDVGIAIRSDDGPSRIAFTRLNAQLRKRFGYDPGAAGKQAQTEAAERQKHEQQMDRAAAAADRATTEDKAAAAQAGPASTGSPAAENDDGEVSATPAVEGLPDTKEVATLNQYIVRLEAGIRRAEGERAEYLAKAQRAESRAMESAFRYSNGVYRTTQRSGQSMALRNYQRKLTELSGSIGAAHRLIAEAEAKLAIILGTPPPQVQ